MAAFNGPASPLTAVKGACPGLSQIDLDTAEAFLPDKRADEAIIELTSWVEKEAVDPLFAWGYR